MVYIPKNDRNRIVGRPDGKLGSGTTVVQCAEIRTGEQLAFAIRFLLDHYLYKHSKVGGVTGENVNTVRVALIAAGNSFEDDIGVDYDLDDPLAGGDGAAQEISGLGKGVIKNPYDYL
jgi:hypothetical protein